MLLEGSPMTFSPTASIGPFIQTSLFFPEEFPEFRAAFLQLYRQLSYTVNIKQIGVFDLQEFLSGEQWFTAGDPQTKRQTFRKAFNIGAIATGATSTTAHGITNISSFTHIYGTAVTDVVDYRPLPYVSTAALNQQTSLTVTATNIVIVNGAAAPNITSSIVVLEYLKN